MSGFDRWRGDRTPYLGVDPGSGHDALDVALYVRSADAASKTFERVEWPDAPDWAPHAVPQHLHEIQRQIDARPLRPEELQGALIQARVGARQFGKTAYALQQMRERWGLGARDLERAARVIRTGGRVHRARTRARHLQPDWRFRWVRFRSGYDGWAWYLPRNGLHAPWAAVLQLIVWRGLAREGEIIPAAVSVELRLPNAGRWWRFTLRIESDAALIAHRLAGGAE